MTCKSLCNLASSDWRMQQPPNPCSNLLGCSHPQFHAGTAFFLTGSLNDTTMHGLGGCACPFARTYSFKMQNSHDFTKK